MDAAKIEMLTLVAKLHDAMDAMGNKDAATLDEMRAQVAWLSAIHKLLDVADAIRAK